MDDLEQLKADLQQLEVALYHTRARARVLQRAIDGIRAQIRNSDPEKEARRLKRNFAISEALIGNQNAKRKS